MTEPGPLERVPTKVVPYVVTGYAEDEVVEEPRSDDLPPEPTAARKRGPLLGVIALVLAILTVATHIAAILLATENHLVTATITGYAAIGLSMASVVVGAIAVILRLGRVWGAVAIALGIVANPFLLLLALRLIEGLVAR